MKRISLMKRLLPVLCFVLILHLYCLASVWAGDGITCDGCGKSITSSYWKLEGKNYCNECYEKKLPRCSKCGQIIRGVYWHNPSGKFCPLCAPKCSICGKNLDGRYWQMDKKNICEKCYHTNGPRCAICNVVLTGKFFRSSKTGKKVCDKCHSFYPACRTCGTPIGPKGTTVDKGFVLCPDCAKKAIVLPGQAIEVFRMARYTVQRILGLEADIPEQNIILASSQTIAAGASESTEYIPKEGSAGLYVFNKGVSTIYVQRGHSPERTLEILAHEYAHLWQEQNCPRDQKIELREGFAEWVSYKVLLNRKQYTIAEAKKKNPDAIYGKGLRMILELEKRIGPFGIIDYVKSHKQ